MPAKVIAIVLNWNGESDTAACLDSLLVQREMALEVLLVDNASADGSGERLRDRYPAVAYLQTGENLGYAGGNNRGITWALARGADWMLVVNNDTVADPDCVRRLLDAGESDERIAALAPLIVRFDAPELVWFAGGTLSRVRAIGRHDFEGGSARIAASLPAEPGGLRACSFLTGCCLLLRTEAIRAEGSFREDFFAYVEDVELSLRLSRAGWRLGWVPGARLLHRVPARSAPPAPWQIALRDRNRRRMVRDLYGWPLRLVFLAWFLPTRCVSLLRYGAHRDWARARAIVRGSLDV